MAERNSEISTKNEEHSERFYRMKSSVCLAASPEHRRGDNENIVNGAMNMVVDPERKANCRKLLVPEY